MSRNESVDPALAALDSELQRMSREVPEMPEAVRQKWREAVRADAAEKRRERETAPQPARRVSARSIRPWRRALSAAAVFLFILGGVLLGGDSLSLIRTPAPESAGSADAGRTDAVPAVSAAEDSLSPQAALSGAARTEAPAAGGAEVSALSAKKAAAFSAANEADFAMEEADYASDEADYAVEEAAAAAEEDAEEPHENGEAAEAVPPSRPLRIIGVSLLGFAALLAVLLLLLRK